MISFLKTFFGSRGSISKPVLTLFLLLNIIVAYNVTRHNSYIGYDAPEHIKYINVLSQGRLPTLEENYEFFSPPAPYLISAIAKASGLVGLAGSARIFLLLNLIYSLLTTFMVLAIWHLVQPENISPPRNTLLLLALLPVYYKSFSMVRAEPMFTALTLTIIWLVLRLALLTNTPESKSTTLLSVACGILLGTAMLTRPWTAFLIIALCFFWIISTLKAAGAAKMRVLRIGAISIFTAILLSSWFYFHLKKDYGSFSAFNRRGAQHFSLSNQAPSFYFGSGNGKVFSDPVRPSFANQLLPILYADTWGDYWCYFQVRGIDTINQANVAGSRLIPPVPQHINSNRDSMTPLLARNNIAGIIPSLLLFSGLVYALLMSIDYTRKRVNISSALPEALCFLCLTAALISFMGYMWFLIMYPHPSEGDTIKASYILNLYPLICIPAGLMISKLEKKNRVIYLAVCTILVLILIHNLPTCLTRYTGRLGETSLPL